MLEMEKEIRSILQENDEFIKLLTNVGLDDESKSIENSHL